MTGTIASSLLLWAVAAAEGEEQLRYLRLLPDRSATECVFTLRRGDQGWKFRSVTERGPTRMTVQAQYDARDVLTAADATLARGDRTTAVQVAVAGGKATVKRAGQDAQEFEVPQRVIVTSAPDWSDTFLLCRYYDRRKGGKQEYVGLWIHPEQAAQRLTFTVERVGSDTIEHEGKKLELERHVIRIRNNSEYAAWTDAAGSMVKLMSLPVKEGAGTELVREGYEKSAAKLRPPPR